MYCLPTNHLQSNSLFPGEHFEPSQNADGRSAGPPDRYSPPPDISYPHQLAMKSTSQNLGQHTAQYAQTLPESIHQQFHPPHDIHAAADPSYPKSHDVILDEAFMHTPVFANNIPSNHSAATSASIQPLQLISQFGHGNDFRADLEPNSLFPNTTSVSTASHELPASNHTIERWRDMSNSKSPSSMPPPSIARTSNSRSSHDYRSGYLPGHSRSTSASTSASSNLKTPPLASNLACYFAPQEDGVNSNAKNVSFWAGNGQGYAKLSEVPQQQGPALPAQAASSIRTTSSSKHVPHSSTCRTAWAPIEVPPSNPKILGAGISYIQDFRTPDNAIANTQVGLSELYNEPLAGQNKAQLLPFIPQEGSNASTSVSRREYNFVAYDGERQAFIGGAIQVSDWLVYWSCHSQTITEWDRENFIGWAY